MCVSVADNMSGPFVLHKLPVVAKKAAAPGQTYRDQINSEKVVKILQREETLKDLFSWKCK